MHIREVFVQGKNVGYCEDAITITPDFVAVVDGVTSLGGVDEPGSGRVAAEAIAETIRKLPVEVERMEAMRLIVESIPVGAAVLAMYSRFWNEIWRIGDVHVCIDGVQMQGIGADRDDAAVRVRVELMRELLVLGYGLMEASELARGEIEPILAKTRLDANVKYGVLLPGIMPPHTFVEVFPAGKLNVLCSDGYVEPCSTLVEAEALVQEVVVRDPFRYCEYPGTKGVPVGGVSFDDRAYVSFGEMI